MFLLVLQLVIISYIVPGGEGRVLGARRKAKPYFSIHQDRKRKEKGGLENRILANTIRYEDLKNKPRIHALIGLVDDINSRADGKNPEQNKVPRSSFLPKDNNIDLSLGNLENQKETANLDTVKTVFFPQLSMKRNTEAPKKQHAKNFWNHFMYKMNAGAQDMVIPIKTQEVQQGICRKVPFNQDIVHKDCDKVVVQNNVCFGACISMQVPGLSDQVYTCSRCLPSKYILKRIELNCTGSSNVAKVIMVVEECNCEIHESNRIQTAHFDMESDNDGLD
ncbi:cerberus [Discoglossus pictus]